MQPLIFLFKSLYAYQLFLSDGLRYATSGMQLVYSQLVFFSKGSNCCLRPKGLTTKHLFLPDMSVWSSKRWSSILQILPFWEGLEWVAGSTKCFSVFFFLPSLVLHSWLFLQTRLMLLMLGNYYKYFHKLQELVCFSCVCIFLISWWMSFWILQRII